MTIVVRSTNNQGEQTMYQTDNVRVRREIADFTSTTHNVFVEEKVNGEWS